jgi:hypothetical protein
MGDYQNRFRNGRSVIENILALKIMNDSSQPDILQRSTSGTHTHIDNIQPHTG